MKLRQSLLGDEILMFVIAVLAAQVIGGLVTQMSPLILGGVIAGFNLSEQQASLAVFAEFFMLSITAIVAAPLLPKLRLRFVCIVATLTAVCFQLASIIANDYIIVTAIRCIAGIGVGLVYAASLAAIGSCAKNPDRVYGYVQVTWTLLSIALFTIGGHVTALYDHKGIYGLILLISLTLLPCLKFLPEEIGEVERAPSKHTSGLAPASLGCLTLIAVFIYITATGALYTFSAPLGERAGLTTTQIGYALTAQSGIGFMGALAASWFNVKHGRMLPITVFLSAFIVIALVLCTNTNPYIFVLFQSFSGIFFYFSVPYLFGLAAALDEQGRWAAAAGSAYLLGFASGPGIAGIAVETVGYPGLGMVCATSFATTWVLFGLVIKRLKTSSSDTAGHDTLTHG
jgi:predicted MFS family arabinose efflux permease